VALTVKSEIESYKPDVVIAADDNASKYVIVPYYKDGAIPVVFCGLNWDASTYGFPCKNVTGMIEVAPVDVLMSHLKGFAKGSRVAVIGPDNETHHKEVANLQKVINGSLLNRTALKFADWKAAFLELQSQSDMLIVENNAGINDWNDTEAEAFVRENTKIPSGTMHDFMTKFALIGFVKSAEEQGEWAAGAAVKILNGTAVSSIPVAKNQRGELYLNMPLAQKLGVSFDLKLVKMAKVVIK
jgi:ABC-type uncharacterized transport system substrate-binding protein